MPVFEIISSVVGIGGLVVAVLVLMYGSGRSTKRFDEKIELTLRRFEDSLDEKLNSRFDLLQKTLVGKDDLRMQLELLGTKFTADVNRLDQSMEQMDERITQAANQTQMVINAVLKSKTP